MDAPERAAAGKAARSAGAVAPPTPRGSHPGAGPTRSRSSSARPRSRVPELVPIRYGRMAASPFAFFRGAAAVMAADLADDAGLRPAGAGLRRRPPLQLRRLRRARPPPRLRPQRLRRVAAGALGVGRQAARRQLRDRRPRKRLQAQAARARRAGRAARSYREAMRAFAAQRNLEVWYARLDVEAVMGEIEAEDPKLAKQVRKGVAKARAKDSLRALEKLTHMVDGELRIVSRTAAAGPGRGAARRQRRASDLEQACCGVLDAYRASLPADRQHLLDGYRFRHLARKVVGVGSVGTRAWVMLLTGADDADPLFLQAKEAEASVLEPYAGASRYREPRPAGGRGPAADAGGQRHLPRLVPGGRVRRPRARLLRAPALGLEALGRSRAPDPARPRDLRAALRLDPGPRPRPLRRPRSRSPPTSAAATPSTGRSPSSPSAYADQSERDHAALVAAIDSGRIAAEEL